MSENQRDQTAEEHQEGRAAAEQQPRPEQAEGNTAESAAVEGTLEDGEEPEGGATESLDDLDPQQLRERIEELESALAQAEEKAQQHWDQLLRLRAEMENTQRRAQKDVEQAKRQGLEKVASDLLQVKDSLEMGVQAAEDAEADREKLLEGTQLTLKMLNQLFERFDIEEIDPVGERFNPDFHEAMATQPSEDQAPNTVLHVVQKGYRLQQERLLRPALVVVAKKSDGGGSIDETA